MNTEVTVPVGYSCYLTTFDESANALAPLCRSQYDEMREHLEQVGVPLPPFNPMFDQYARASRSGHLLIFRVDYGAHPVGYALVYLTHDPHNRDLTAREDGIYVVPRHRNGIGRLLMKTIEGELRRREVKRFRIGTSTDPRVAKLLQRMGYKHAASLMVLPL